MFGSIIHQGIGGIYQIIKSRFSTSFQLHLKTSGTTQSRYYRWSRQVDLTFRIFFEVFLYRIHNFFDAGILPFFPWFQNHSQFRTSLITTDTRTATRHILNIFYIRILFQISYGTFRHNTGTLQCSAFRQLKFNFKISLIFHRQETGRNNTVN